MEYKWCVSLPLLRGARSMKEAEENIPPAPLKWGGRGGRSVFTQWIPPHLHVEYKWCASLPLLRGIQVVRQPSPLERGQGYEKKQKKTYPRPL